MRLNPHFFFDLSLPNLYRFDFSHPDLALRPIADPERMRKGGFCDESLVDALWAQKSRCFSSLIPLLPLSSPQYGRHLRLGQVLRLLSTARLPLPRGPARQRHLPQPRRRQALADSREDGSLRGHLTAHSVHRHLRWPRRLLAAPPRSRPQALLWVRSPPLFPKLHPHTPSFGITLEIESTGDAERWYSDLRTNPSYTICKGKDETGNVFLPENLDHTEKLIRFEMAKISLAVSDGGFEIQKNDKGEHAENLQELYSGRIILSEYLMMLKVLVEGGHFVVKLFDALSAFTQSLIFLTCHLFKECHIVKPLRSRIGNSERYLVGRFLKKGPTFEFAKKLLTHLHKECRDDSSPLSAVPLDLMRSDPVFMQVRSLPACFPSSLPPVHLPDAHVAVHAPDRGAQDRPRLCGHGARPAASPAASRRPLARARRWA